MRGLASMRSLCWIGRLAGAGAGGAGADAAVHRLRLSRRRPAGHDVPDQAGRTGPGRRQRGARHRPGVTAKVVEYYRRLNNQEMQLLSEQLRELKRGDTARRPPAMAPMMDRRDAGDDDDVGDDAARSPAAARQDEAAPSLIARIEKRIAEYVQHAGLRFDLQPGPRRGHDRSRRRARASGNSAWPRRAACRTRWSSTSARCPRSPASRCSPPLSRCSARRSWPCASGRPTRSRSASPCPAP